MSSLVKTPSGKEFRRVNGQWLRTDTPPTSISMRQARLALLEAGLLSQVDAAIAALPSPQMEAAQIEWEYATELQRDNPLLLALAPALGLTNEQVDELFMAAALK